MDWGVGEGEGQDTNSQSVTQLHIIKQPTTKLQHHATTNVYFSHIYEVHWFHLDSLVYLGSNCGLTDLDRITWGPCTRGPCLSPPGGWPGHVVMVVAEKQGREQAFSITWLYHISYHPIGQRQLTCLSQEPPWRALLRYTPRWGAERGKDPLIHHNLSVVAQIILLLCRSYHFLFCGASENICMILSSFIILWWLSCHNILCVISSYWRWNS